MLLMLEIVARGPVTVAKAIDQTGLDRNTVRRLLSNLEQNRVIVRDLLGRYVIGPKLAELYRNRFQDPLQYETDEILQELHRETSSDIALYWADGIYRVCIAAFSNAPTGRYLQVGARLEPSGCASCLTLLAWSAQRRLAARNLHISNNLFSIIRQQGWASSVDQDGIGEISAPIRNPLGEVVAAIAIFGGSVLASTRAAKLVAPYVTSAGKLLTDAMIRAPQ